MNLFFFGLKKNLLQFTFVRGKFGGNLIKFTGEINIVENIPLNLKIFQILFCVLIPVIFIDCNISLFIMINEIVQDELIEK